MNCQRTNTYSTQWARSKIMSTKRIISVYGDKCIDNLQTYGKYNERYSISNEALQSIPFTYEKPAIAHFDENHTCVLSAPLGYKGDENYKFSDLTCFEVLEKGHWVLNKCKNCDSLVNFPTKLEKCLICDNGEYEHTNKGIGNLRRNPKEFASTYEANPEMVARAQQDLSDNPVPGTNDPGVDWGYLKESLD